MTPSRKLTLSVKEFSHLVSESLDVGSPTQTFIHQLPVVQSEAIENPKSSSFHRIFSRPSLTSAPHEDTPEIPAESIPDTPRKMGFGWPFSRSSPQKRRSPSSGLGDADIGQSPGRLRPSKSTDALKGYRSAASAAGSTSSLGSLVPVHERMFSDVARESLFSVAGQAASSSASSPLTVAHSQRSTVSLVSRVSGPVGEHVINLSREASLVKPARESADSSSTLPTTTETDFSDDDPTPRATTFGARAVIPQAVSQHRVTLAQRRRPQNLSLVLPIKNCDALSLRPAVGATPHPPSDTEGSVSASSIPSPTSPLPHQPSVASMSIWSCASVASTQRVRSLSPPKSPAYATPSDLTRSPNSASVSPVNGFPWGRARAGSRSTKSPPLPRPPPRGPLPAVPISLSDSVPPVPPLPSLLKKKSITRSSKLPASSPSRPAFPSSTLSVATPPSPPGNLRLPSRLSWIGAGRAVVASSSSSSTLPSPPASPTKSPKSRLTPPSTPSRTTTTTTHRSSSGHLKRPTSIGVLEAADNAVVRRTKSILLLGSRSKSNGCLGVSSASPPKRVQIHADANVDAASPTRKPRRKSSAVPTSSSTAPILCGGSGSAGGGGGGDDLIGAQLLVPRERRHSAPLLRGTTPDGDADWTLSLPLCIDVPGGKMAPPSPPPPPLPLSSSSPSSDRLAPSEAEVGEDWTLCMPLKVCVEQAGTTAVESDESVSECTKTSETCGTTQTQTQTQLPTPSPSPTPSTPLPSPRALERLTRRPSNETLGPHAGGLDMDGGCGKRGSGWDVSGWFGPDVDVVPSQEEHQASSSSSSLSSTSSTSSTNNSDRAVRRTARGRTDEMKVPIVRMHEGSVRNPSQDSTTTTSTLETVFYSARSSLLSDACA